MLDDVSICFRQQIESSGISEEEEVRRRKEGQESSDNGWRADEAPRLLAVLPFPSVDLRPALRVFLCLFEAINVTFTSRSRRPLVCCSSRHRASSAEEEKKAENTCLSVRAQPRLKLVILSQLDVE